jgi:hypothetical protein
VSTFNPLRGCNSDLAQYSNNSATPTLLFENEDDDEDEDDFFDAPGEDGRYPQGPKPGRARLPKNPTDSRGFQRLIPTVIRSRKARRAVVYVAPPV